MTRQYSITEPGVISALPTQNGPLNHYSVKLGQLCPQLKNLSLVDATKLLAKGGLVITIRLLESDYCMNGFNAPAAPTSSPTLFELRTRAEYYISNCYLGVVQHSGIP